MVERSLSMREVPGSMPGSSTSICPFSFSQIIPQLNANYNLMLQSCPTRCVRMAERSKAPDSRGKTLSSNGAFWSTIVGVGSNPTSDMSICNRNRC